MKDRPRRRILLYVGLWPGGNTNGETYA